MRFEYPEGATPLDEDYRQDLIPDLQLQAELNEFEQKNIVEAILWATDNSRFSEILLSSRGLCELHRRMFNSTWRWAGRYRRRNTNIGVEWQQIPENVILVCRDAEYWVANHVYEWMELAVRFHHRLVLIHPFPNGNGRHARLAANLLLGYNGQAALPWGGAHLDAKGEARSEYISALQEADRNSYDRLLSFAVSGRE